MKSAKTCHAALCRKNPTHTLTMVLSDGLVPENNIEAEYCLEHAIYFAAWLPYCYPEMYESVSISPPAREFFKLVVDGQVEFD